MADIISAADLEVGDLYRDGRGEVFKVITIRTINLSAEYRQVEAFNISQGNGASLHLRTNISVARLDAGSTTAARMALDALTEGKQISVVRHDGRLWW